MEVEESDISDKDKVSHITIAFYLFCLKSDI